MSERVGGTSADRREAPTCSSDEVDSFLWRTASAFFVRLSLKLRFVSFLPNVWLNFAIEDDTEDVFVTTSPESSCWLSLLLLLFFASSSACKLFCRSNARFFRSIGEIKDVRCTTSTRCFSESVMEISLFSSSTAAALEAAGGDSCCFCELPLSCSFFLLSASIFSCWRRFRSAGEMKEVNDDCFLAFWASSSVSSSSLSADDFATPSRVGGSLYDMARASLSELMEVLSGGWDAAAAAAFFCLMNFMFIVLLPYFAGGLKEC